MRKRTLVLQIGAGAIVALWAAFRPENTAKGAGFVTPGAFKGNEGDPNYEIPAGAAPLVQQ